MTATTPPAFDETALRAALASPEPASGDAPGSVRELQARLEAQAALIREQSAALAERAKTFERASLAARIGIWECDLRDQSLRWSDMVYDLFDLPRGSELDRGRTLTFYPAKTRKILERVRAKAIRERGGFTLDAEIVTAKGRRRVIRLTATVECENGEPVRIFGMKQDVTEETEAADRIRRRAEIDAMTGLANRSRFESEIKARLRRPARAKLDALLLIDLDGFKQINDTFGHALGDECLKEAGVRLTRLCAGGVFVARVGGDEFAALCRNDEVAALAWRIVDALGEPVVHGGRTLRLGASVGLAPAQGCTPAELFARADSALYAAKRAGRNTVRAYEHDGARPPVALVA